MYRILQFGHARECAPPVALACDPGEETLNELKPRRRRWREMAMEAGMFREPSLHLGRVVGCVVFENQTHGAINASEELQELLGAVAR